MIEYIGEHLWIGQVGQFLIFLAFFINIATLILNVLFAIFIIHNIKGQNLTKKDNNI